MALRGHGSPGGTRQAGLALATVLLLVLAAESTGKSQLSIVEDIDVSLKNILEDIQSLRQFITTTPSGVTSTAETSSSSGPTVTADTTTTGDFTTTDYSATSDTTDTNTSGDSTTTETGATSDTTTTGESTTTDNPTISESSTTSEASSANGSSSSPETSTLSTISPETTIATTTSDSTTSLTTATTTPPTTTTTPTTPTPTTTTTTTTPTTPTPTTTATTTTASTTTPTPTTTITTTTTPEPGGPKPGGRPRRSSYLATINIDYGLREKTTATSLASIMTDAETLDVFSSDATSSDVMSSEETSAVTSSVYTVPATSSEFSVPPETTSSPLPDVVRLRTALEEADHVVMQVAEGTINEGQVAQMQAAEAEVKDVSTFPDDELVELLQNEPGLIDGVVERIEKDAAIISSTIDSLKIKNTNIIVGSVLGGILLIVFVVLGAVFYMRQKKKKQTVRKATARKLSQSAAAHGQQQMVELGPELGTDNPSYVDEVASRPMIPPNTRIPRASLDNFSLSSSQRRNPLDLNARDREPSLQRVEMGTDPGIGNLGSVEGLSPRPIVPPKPRTPRTNLDNFSMSPGPVATEQETNMVIREPLLQRAEIGTEPGLENSGYLGELPLRPTVPPKPRNPRANLGYLSRIEPDSSMADFGSADQNHYIDELNTRLKVRGAEVHPGPNYYGVQEPKRRSHRDHSPRHHHHHHHLPHGQHRSKSKRDHHIRRTPSMPPPDYTLPRNGQSSKNFVSRQHSLQKQRPEKPYIDFEPPRGTPPLPETKAPRPERNRSEFRRPYGPEDLY